MGGRGTLACFLPEGRHLQRPGVLHSMTGRKRDRETERERDGLKETEREESRGCWQLKWSVCVEFKSYNKYNIVFYFDATVSALQHNEV